VLDLSIAARFMMKGAFVGHLQAQNIGILNLGAEANYVADTGPLLCIGGSKQIRDIIQSRCYRKTHWVDAVRSELLRQSKGSDARARAAQMYNGKGAFWLTETVTFTALDEADVERIRNRLKVLGDAKAQRKGRRPSTHPQANLGEAQSILHARRHKHTLLAHDDDARIVAREHGVPAATIVDLARRLVSEGFSAKKLANEFLTLQRDGIDTGEHITGQLDLRPRRQPTSVPRPRPPTQADGN